MEYYANGKILRGLGGLYCIRLDRSAGQTDNAGQHVPDTPEDSAESTGTAAEPCSPLAGHDILCRAKGAFRHAGITPLVGDRVKVRYTDASFIRTADGKTPGGSPCVVIPSPDGTDVRIEDIIDRRNSLIRPAMANLDELFIFMAAASPAPLLDVVDKLISIAEFNEIEPVIVIGKCELDPQNAARITEIYRQAGFSVFPLSAKTGEGVGAVREFVRQTLPGHTAAFSGASGVGKSSLLNTLFPDLHLETSEVSRKIGRGRHTTRRVELYPLDFDGVTGYLADTPGFSMLDFVRFDFFGKDDLPGTFREFRPYLGHCRYTSCTHTKEEDCAIVQAVRAGKIPKSRHDSFLSMYRDLKDKHDWDKK